MKTITAILLFVCAAFIPLNASSSTAQAPSTIKNVFWQPDELQSGSVVFFTIELNRYSVKVTGSFLGKDLLFFRSDKPKVWYALAGVDVETSPGTYDLAIRAVLPGRRVARALKKVDITEAHFKSGTADVPENFVNPDEASKKQVAADQVLKDRAFAHLIPTPQWSGDFVKPVDAPATDSFGMTRVLNEEMTSEHRGTDFPVKEGSPVLASNRGTVVLARGLFYEGNCVVLDHGQHFFTIYMHLSKIQVRQGMKVRKGQRLGLSGATGRVTGPHLHMGVRWEGAYVDPIKLLALTLPDTHRVARTTATARRR
jgi:murein DD-endopeptidase MepM/ murein hydrolase activator NlpD